MPQQSIRLACGLATVLDLFVVRLDRAPCALLRSRSERLRHISSAGCVPSGGIAAANVELRTAYHPVIGSNPVPVSKQPRECPRPSLLETPAGPSAFRTIRSRTQIYLSAGRRPFLAPVPGTCRTR